LLSTNPSLLLAGYYSIANRIEVRVAILFNGFQLVGVDDRVSRVVVKV
jgi:hypothetical protein